MNTALLELLKKYVKNQKFSSTAEIMTAMKELIPFHRLYRRA